MFIYILNLLNDNLKKKNNIYERSASEIINDTKYISQLAGIKKTFDFESINNEIISIFEILNKYNLSNKDCKGIMNMLLRNKNNSWILEKGKMMEEYMNINHIALWTNNIEKMKDYYVKYFNGEAGEKYCNESKGFTSYFISFDSGARIEIMSKKNSDFKEPQSLTKGYAHMAISVGSKEKVDSLTEEIRKAGYEVTSETRTTDDGYYESCVLDPEGNLVEITI